MRGIVIGNKSDGNVFCLPHGPCQTTLLEKTFFFFGFLSLYFGLSLCKHTEFTVPCDCRLMGQMNGRTDLFNGVWSQRWSRQRQHNAHKAHPSRAASSLERQPDSVLHIYSLLAPSSVLHSSPIYFLSFFCAVASIFAMKFISRHYSSCHCPFGIFMYGIAWQM